MALAVTDIMTIIGGIIRNYEINYSYLKTRLETSKDDLLGYLDAAGDTRSERSLNAAQLFLENSGGTISVDQLLNDLEASIENLNEALELPRGTDAVTTFRRFRQWMIDNSESVASRGLTFGTPSYSASTGDGELVILSKDDNDQDNESVWAQKYTIEITEDQTTPGSLGRNKEGFEIRGAFSEDNGFARATLKESNNVASGTVKSSSDTEISLLNPSFDEFTPEEYPTFTGPLTDLPGWTVSSFSGLTIDTTNYWLANEDDATPVSLSVTAVNPTISQKFSALNFKFDPFLPYLPGFYYNRSLGSASGTISLTIGSLALSHVLSTETGWNRFPIASADLYKLWSKHFTDASDPAFTIGSSGLSGTILYDHCFVLPFEFFDNTPFLLLAGSTPFVNRDKITFSISQAARAILQIWSVLTTGIHLPTDGSPTWSPASLYP